MYATHTRGWAEVLKASGPLFALARSTARSYQINSEVSVIAPEGMFI